MDKLVKNHIKKAVFMPSVDEGDSKEVSAFGPAEESEEKQKVVEKKDKKSTAVIKKRVRKKKTRIRKRF